MTNDQCLIKKNFDLFQLFVLILFCSCFGYFCFSDSTDSTDHRLWVVWAIMFQFIWRRSWQTLNTPCIVQCSYTWCIRPHTKANTLSTGELLMSKGWVVYVKSWPIISAIAKFLSPLVCVWKNGFSHCKVKNQSCCRIKCDLSKPISRKMQDQWEKN